MSPPRPNRIGLATFAAAVAIAFAASAPRPACAQDGREEGLSVVGKGAARAKPTLVEIDLDVSASAELTGDAIVKFRDAKKRVHDAFAALKLPDVTVEERGLAVDQKGAAFNPYMMDMGMQSKAKTEVQLSRKLVVKATKIGAMEEEAVLQLVGRLLDVAQDAGAHVGPQNNPYMYYRYGGMPANGLVRFVVEDYEKLKEEAYAKAAADARARAERLARLNGVALGMVEAVREVSGPGSSGSPYGNMYGYPEPTDGADEPRERLTTEKFQEVPIRVELSVRYAIKPGGGSKP